MWFNALILSLSSGISSKVSCQDHPPITQIPALLDHVQDVGLSAGAGQTGEEEDSGPGGGVGMSEAFVVVKPIQRDLSSICCLNELTAETSQTRNSATRICIFIYLFICTILTYANTEAPLQDNGDV